MESPPPPIQMAKIAREIARKQTKALKMKRQEIMCSLLVCGDVAFTNRGVPTFKIWNYTGLQLFRFSFSVLIEWIFHEFLCR